MKPSHTPIAVRLEFVGFDEPSARGSSGTARAARSLLRRPLAENYQMKVIYSSLAILLAGCTSNSGVIPIGPDTFLVSRQAATGFSGSGTLKAEAFQEANQYCLGQKKKLQVVNTVEA